MHRLILCLVAASVTVSAAESAGKPAAALIAVASNFREVQEALSARFAANTGQRMENTYSSTGKLSAQIVNGAPYDAFLSADTRHVDLLEQKGLALKPSRFTYAIGRLALYTKLPQEQAVSVSLLGSAEVKHIALANPDLAPYGLAAVQYLKGIGLWEPLRPKVVQGETIAQAFQFVETQAAECGLVALSQVIKRDPRQYLVIPASRHEPIRQDAAMLAHGNGNAAARAYLTYLRSEEARAVIREFGYALDGDDLR